MGKLPEFDPLAKFHPVTFSLFLTLLSIVSCVVVRHARGSGPDRPPTGTLQDQMVLVSCVAPVTGGVSAVDPAVGALNSPDRAAGPASFASAVRASEASTYRPSPTAPVSPGSR